MEHGISGASIVERIAKWGEKRRAKRDMARAYTLAYALQDGNRDRTKESALIDFLEEKNNLELWDTVANRTFLYSTPIRATSALACVLLDEKHPRAEEDERYSQPIMVRRAALFLNEFPEELGAREDAGKELVDWLNKKNDFHLWKSAYEGVLLERYGHLDDWQSRRVRGNETVSSAAAQIGLNFVFAYKDDSDVKSQEFLDTVAWTCAHFHEIPKSAERDTQEKRLLDLFEKSDSLAVWEAAASMFDYPPTTEEFRRKVQSGLVLAGLKENSSDESLSVPVFCVFQGIQELLQESPQKTGNLVDALFDRRSPELLKNAYIAISDEPSVASIKVRFAYAYVLACENKNNTDKQLSRPLHCAFQSVGKLPSGDYRTEKETALERFLQRHDDSPVLWETAFDATTQDEKKRARYAFEAVLASYRNPKSSRCVSDMNVLVKAAVPHLAQLQKEEAKDWDRLNQFDAFLLKKENKALLSTVVHMMKDDVPEKWMVEDMTRLAEAVGKKYAKLPVDVIYNVVDGHHGPTLQTFGCAIQAVRPVLDPLKERSGVAALRR